MDKYRISTFFLLYLEIAIKKTFREFVINKKYESMDFA